MKKLFYIGALSALLLAACGGDEKEGTEKQEETQQDSTQTETNAEPEKEESSTNDVYFKDGEAKLEDIKIKITETKVIPIGEKGNEYGDKPVLAFWYDTTNLSDKDIDPMMAWIAVFEAIQDNDPNAVNTLNVGSLPDDAFLDSQTQTIKKDGTVSNAMAYELDDLETPVTLVAKQGLMGDELGRQDYPVK